jgi:hypothetical protein
MKVEGKKAISISSRMICECAQQVQIPSTVYYGGRLFELLDWILSRNLNLFQFKIKMGLPLCRWKNSIKP